MRKLNDTNRTRKRSVRHSWIKAGPGIQRCAIYRREDRSLRASIIWRALLYDRRDTRMQGFKRVLLIKNMRYGNVV